MSEITIAKGLSRLKTIKAQLEKINGNIKEYSTWNNRRKHPLGGNNDSIEKTHNQAQEQVNSWYQSYNDLVAEYLKIRLAIDKANLETKIIVAGQEMTIKEALFYKSEITSFKRDIINSYLNGLANTTRDVEIYNKNFANSPDEIKKLNLADISYFLDLKKIDNIKNFVAEFCSEIDGELNSVNALTKLDV